MDKIENFLRDLITMFAEHNTEYPSLWKEIPKKYKKDFLSWVAEYKQQTWEGNEERAWEIYQREYLVFLINGKIEELKQTIVPFEWLRTKINYRIDYLKYVKSKQKTNQQPMVQFGINELKDLLSMLKKRRLKSDG